MMKSSHSRLLVLIVSILVFCSCSSKPKTSSDQSEESLYTIHYAKGFGVKKYSNYTEVTVRNPWDTLHLLQKYILIDRNKLQPDNLPDGTIIRVPLSNVVVYSSIHCSSLNELSAIDIVRGVCEPEYIKVADIQNRVKNGDILNLGMAANPDIEQIINLSPEAVFTTPISGQSYGNIVKTKIPLIETIDYTELNPLGRAEWLRFYSLFIGKEKEADSLFNITVKNYNEIKERVAKSSVIPTVFPDTRYQANWNVPGGKSNMANMLADAGAAYVWADDTSSTFLPLSFETVLDKAGEADIWVIKYYSSNDMTYESLAKEYKSYSYFKAFKEHNIWGCNTQYSTYYEDLPIHPDWILKDFAYIFHPELFLDYTPRYYKKLK